MKTNRIMQNECSLFRLTERHLMKKLQYLTKRTIQHGRKMLHYKLNFTQLTIYCNSRQVTCISTRK